VPHAGLTTDIFSFFCSEGVLKDVTDENGNNKRVVRFALNTSAEGYSEKGTWTFQLKATANGTDGVPDGRGVGEVAWSEGTATFVSECGPGSAGLKVSGRRDSTDGSAPADGDGDSDQGPYQ